MFYKVIIGTPFVTHVLAENAESSSTSHLRVLFLQPSQGMWQLIDATTLPIMH